MDVSIRVPAGMEALSVGRLESADSAAEKDFDTWHWISRQPMATYLNFVCIGQFEVRQGTQDGLPYVYAVSEQLKPENRKRAFDALLTSTERVRTMEQMFGPYPFSEIGGVVPAHDLPFGALENQTRPVYNPGAILAKGYAPELMNHELAHMWFGDNVTLREWNDIFTNEAYASWAQWIYNERTGKGKANDKLNETYNQYAHDAGFWQVTMIDPSQAAPVRRGLRPRPDGDAGGAQRDGRRGVLPVHPGVGPGAGQPQPGGLDGCGPGGQPGRPRPGVPGLDLLPHRPGEDGGERLPLTVVRCRSKRNRAK